nr:hypothetical protein HK105_008367 [Polyrhizophydium stewartii]
MGSVASHPMSSASLGTVFVHFASVKTLGVPLIALVFACIAVVATLYGAGFFFVQALKRRFTVTLASLMLVNFLSAMLQVVEAVFSYTDNTVTPIRVWRNWLYAITTMLSNLVQLGILSIFENNLWHGRVFSAKNMWIVYTIAVVVHLLCALPTYAEGILFVNDGQSLVGKYSIFAMGGYAFLIGIWGIVQGLFVLSQVQRHLINVTVNQTDSSFRRNNARTIRSLILFTLVVDLFAIAAFALANVVGFDMVERQEQSFALQQLAFALASIHLASETLLFQATVQQFRKSSRSNSRNRPGILSPASPGGYSSHGANGSGGGYSSASFGTSPQAQTGSYGPYGFAQPAPGSQAGGGRFGYSSAPPKQGGSFGYSNSPPKQGGFVDPRIATGGTFAYGTSDGGGYSQFSSQQDPSLSQIPIPLLIFALIVNILATAGTFGAIVYFFVRGIRTGFKRLIVTLVAVNVVALSMQASELARIYLDRSAIWPRVWRNCSYSLCSLVLLLLEIAILELLNPNLLRVSALGNNGIRVMKITTIAIHIALVAPNYFEGLLFINDGKSWLGAWATFGSACFSFLVGILGISQNIYIAAKIRNHFSEFRSGPANSGRKRKMGNTVMVMIYSMMLVDLLSLISFVITVLIKEPVATKLAFEQLAFDIGSGHLTGESALFQLMGLRLRFSRAILAMIVVNVIAIVLQISTALFTYSCNKSLFVILLHNLVYGLAPLTMQLISIDILAVVNDSLFGIKALSRDRIIFWSFYGSAFFCLLVAIQEAAQNIVLIHKLRKHIQGLGISETKPSRCERLQALQIVLMMTGIIALDFLAFCAFALSVIYGQNPGDSLSLQQVSFALAGLHMTCVGFLYRAMTLRYQRATSDQSLTMGSSASSP